MPKEVSARNTLSLVRYLRKYHSGLDLEGLIDRIVLNSPCFVENLQNGSLEQVTLLHLQNPRYWFSHAFVKSLHDLIEEQIPDPGLGFKIGQTICHTQPVAPAALGLSLLGLHGVVERALKEVIKYDRTKTYSIRRLSRGSISIQIIHNPGIVVSEFAIQWHAGYFAVCALLAGATSIRINLDCIDPGPISQDDRQKAIWGLTLQYLDPGLPVRLARALLLTLPWVRTRSGQPVIAEAGHQDTILIVDTTTRVRTDNNVLSVKGKPEDEEQLGIEEKLPDNLTRMLALNLSNFNAVQHADITSDEKEKIEDHLELALNDLRSLTSQISPPVLYDFGLEAALEWLVNDINNRQNMHLLFVNLLDCPLNPGPQQKVALYRAIRELVTNIIQHSETSEGQIILSLEENEFIVEVEDEGIGFDPDMISQGFGLDRL